jgi:DNA-binding transcriptional LysR family regulator
MEIQQILGFIAVAQSGSFSQAAQRTLRTQPAVSLQVRALEEEFKTRLFDRLGPQKVTLTDEGRLLYELLVPIAQDIRQLEERFNEARNRHDQFSVIVASHNSAILNLLPGVVKAFSEQYPKTKLSIVNRQRDGILSMVKNDEAQIGITSIAKPPAWAVYEVLGRFRRVLICKHDHPLKAAKRITLEEIARYPLILPPIGSNTRAAIDRAFAGKGVSYELALEVMGREAVKSFVGLGLGVTILSEYYLSRENRRSLIVKDVSEHFGHSESGLLLRKGRHLNQAARHFMELVRKEIKKAGPAAAR